jgi:hypothetical protein
MSNATQFVTTPPDNRPASQHTALAGARLAAGLVQGIALYLLYLADDSKTWPSTDPYWMEPLALIFAFVPLLFQQAVGTMRLRTLAIWIAAAAIILAGLAWCDVWRQGLPRPIGFSDSGEMTFALVAFTVIGLFIAQSLIAAADAERRTIASYSAYFDAAWKLEIQLLLAAVFVGVFWGVLWLGATLFNMINLKFIQDLIEETWFAIPATALATAAAIHATDVRARLVAGIRTVAHTLLSWLLPLMVLIAVGFTLSLPFTGLTPLWATKSAAAYLLIACGVLVILINAAFQDGDPQHNRGAVFRYAELAAAVALVPFVLIAAYALSLRVGQYGWTVERVATAATLIVAAVYAFGYAAAAVLSLLGGVWMALVARVNIAAAFLVLAILLLLFTPIGDPARLAVRAQVARLQSGAVTAKAFDFDYLRNQGARYGRDALAELSTGSFGADTDTVHRMAKAALAGVSTTLPATRTDLADNIIVYPSSRALPRGFLEQDWSKDGGAPGCLTAPNVRCDAFFGDFDGDGNEDVVLIGEATSSSSFFWGTILSRRPDKTWTEVANINGNCAGMLDALKQGRASIEPPRPKWRDWVILGVHVHPSPNTSDVEPCPTH